MALRDFLKNIADAIRKKNGATTEINAQNFSSEIEKTSAKAKVMVNNNYIPETGGVTFEGDDFAGMTSLSERHFCTRHGFDKIVIPDLDADGKGITKLSNYCFYDAMIYPNNLGATLAQFPERAYIIGNGITEIPSYCFSWNTRLKYIELRGDITKIGTGAFSFCAQAYNYSKIIIKMVNCTTVPTLAAISVFNHDGGDLNGKGIDVIVPDALYDEWIAATNWANVSTKNVTIVKESDYEASLIAEVAE